MRAVTFDRYGPPEVLRIDEVACPTPAEDEVLVRVHATTATRSDSGLRSAEYFIARFFTGLLRPRRGRVGIEFAGEVETVGAKVNRFAVGDRVFGIRSGANADYVCVPEAGAIARIPDEVTAAEAAAHTRMSKWHFQRLCRQGRGPDHVGTGKLVRFRRSIVDLWLDSQGRHSS